jgi:hypothetical protein
VFQIDATHPHAFAAQPLRQMAANEAPAPKTSALDIVASSHSHLEARTIWRKVDRV